MIKMLHSVWAWAVLAILVIALINAILGMTSNRTFTKKDRTISLMGLIAAHLQLLFGLGVFFVSAGYLLLKTEGMKAVMKDDLFRDQVMEHPLVMIIGILLITIGFSKHKGRSTDKAKFKTISIYYGIALLLFLGKIPWGQWL